MTPKYTEDCKYMLKPELPTNQDALAKLRQKNNPNNEPVGDFTGRCRHCGSNDLWDDNLAYGCNSCHAMLRSN